MLKINSLGGLSIEKNGQLIYPDLGPIITELFAYLLHTNSRPSPRDVIAEMLWPEKSEAQSRSSMNSAIWRLKTALETYGLDANIKTARCADTVRLEMIDVQTDNNELRNAVTRAERNVQMGEAIPPQLLTDLAGSIASYAGAYFPQFDRQWILEERENIRCLYVRGCSILMRHYADEEKLELAISYARKILKQDDLRENVHRQLIWLYVMNGQRAQAVKQYETLESLLRDELGIAPMTETRRLYNLVIQGESSGSEIDIEKGSKSVVTTLAGIGKFIQEQGNSRSAVFSALTVGQMAEG